ncbi:MAG TPA: hypothetical protein VFJ58_22310 [Armatimonadota bacterium]|nr:hypothetical protein [Armatimonadota bacterium]
MSDRNHVARRSRGRKNGGSFLVKALSLLVAGLAGYYLGVRWIGPNYIGHANAAVSAASNPAPVAPVARSSDTPVAPAANVTPMGAPPVAIITDSRHHRGVDGSLTGSTNSADATRPHPVIRHRRRRPPHPHVDTNVDQAVGDQTVLPEDAAKIGGADNQPAGQDSTGLDTPSVGDNSTAAPAAGDTNPTGASGDAGAPAAGDSTAPKPHRKPRRRRRKPPTASPAPPSPGTPGVGDTTPTAGDNSAPGGSDHGAGSRSVLGHWVSV